MKNGIHKLNRSRTLQRFVVIGCGGTGSAVIGGLPFLHQGLIAMGQPGLHLIVADGDKVSATNCVRQPFSESRSSIRTSRIKPWLYLHDCFAMASFGMVLFSISKMAEWLRCSCKDESTSQRPLRRFLYPDSL